MDYKKWYQAHAAQIQKDFFTFLSFPSISADPHYTKDVRRTAVWLVDYLKQLGMDVELWETPGQPCVFATYMKAGRDQPTVLIYQHYDVQPVDPLELWHSDPFKPVVKDNQVYARGASDNKGQCFFSITAIGAYIKHAEKVGINIKLFIEGEEESGGVGTTAILKQKKEALKADHLIVVDLGLSEPGVPSITLGMRGITTMEVECTAAKIDLHSGEHGGIVLNPIRALAKVLAQMWDDKGKVTIPGFYDHVEELSAKDRAQIDWTFDQKRYAAEFGVTAFAGEPGYSLKESGMSRPTLEINGISGGYAGEGFKTVLPAKAVAKISCRLVPNQDPDHIFQCVSTFFKTHLAKGIGLKVECHHGGAAFRSPSKARIVQVAAQAYEEVFGMPCRFSLAGGSIPIVPALAEACGGDVALLGVALATDDIHAPNEHFGLDRFELGFLTMTRLFHILAGESHG